MDDMNEEKETERRNEELNEEQIVIKCDKLLTN